MSGSGKQRFGGVVSARACGLLGLVLLSACNSPPAAEAPPQAAAANSAAPAPAPAPAAAGSEKSGALNASARPQPKGAASLEEEQERRGPTRQARCRIDEEPERPCSFTPVFGDGSFDIEMPDRQLRLIVSDGEAAPFELIGQRRIPVVGLLQRDPKDPACWVSDDPDASLKRVCAR